MGAKASTIATGGAAGSAAFADHPTAALNDHPITNSSSSSGGSGTVAGPSAGGGSEGSSPRHGAESSMAGASHQQQQLQQQPHSLLHFFHATSDGNARLSSSSSIVTSSRSPPPPSSHSSSNPTTAATFVNDLGSPSGSATDITARRASLGDNKVGDAGVSSDSRGRRARSLNGLAAAAETTSNNIVAVSGSRSPPFVGSTGHRRRHFVIGNASTKASESGENVIGQRLGQSCNRMAANSSRTLHGSSDVAQGSNSLPSPAQPGSLLPPPLHFISSSLSSLSPSSFNAGIRCPVCSKTVMAHDCELHLVLCLTRPSLAYNEQLLSEDRLDVECVICLEEFSAGQTIARLPCLCIYHKSCIDAWFCVNRSCPEHPSD